MFAVLRFFGANNSRGQVILRGLAWTGRSALRPIVTCILRWESRFSVEEIERSRLPYAQVSDLMRTRSLKRHPRKVRRPAGHVCVRCYRNAICASGRLSLFNTLNPQKKF